MSDLNEYRTPEQEIVKKTEQDALSLSNTISIGLAKYFTAALERLNYLEYGDPSEYVLRTKSIEVPNSILDVIWVPPIFRQQDEAGDEVLFNSFLADNNKCQVILADPGCGKSTLARYLSCLFIKKFIENAQNYFGIYVPLSTIRLSGKTYQEAVAYCAAKYVGLENDGEVIQELVRNISHACIIFDGLDELPLYRTPVIENNPVSLRHEAAGLIRSLLYVQVSEIENTTPVRLIVTTRSKDYFEDHQSSLGSVPHFFISKFSPSQMKLAIEKWHNVARSYSKSELKNNREFQKKLDERQKAILGSLRENSELGNVCLTPLMLSALLTVYSDAKDLPSSVSQLCWRSINWFFIEKHQATSQDAFVKEYGPWLLDTITEIGWKVHERVTSGDLKSFDNNELRLFTRTSCKVKNFSKLTYGAQEDMITQIVAFLRRGHGILVKLADEEFDFVHNVFREVVAGRALERLTIPERRNYAINELWHGPIRYWAGLRATERDGLYEISALVGELLEDVKNKNTQAILACAEMLVEMCFIVPPEKFTHDIGMQINVIRAALCDLLQSESTMITHRIRIGDLLATLGDPRLEQPVSIRVHWIEPGHYDIGRSTNHLTRIPKYQSCPASPVIKGQLKKFGIGKYLVTNSEFEQFIKDDGYNEQKYWPNPTSLKWALGDRETIDFLISKSRSLSQVHFSSELEGQRLVLEDIPERIVQMIDRRTPMYWVDPANNRPNQPVVGINWWEAVAYCLWLEQKLKKERSITPTQSVRLPIEAEWETSAKLCGNGIYPWIDGLPEHCAFVSATFKKGGIPPLFRSCGVGLFEFVKAGCPIFDLVGNVWEWSASKANPYSGTSFNQEVNYESLDDRISRGSSWLSSEEESTQITFRSFDPPYFAYEDLGFRIIII